MKSFSLYLDTSAINFLFADDAPEKKEATVELFENFIKPGIYTGFVSDYVLTEINKTESAEKRQKLIDVIDDYYIEVLENGLRKEVEDLAEIYLRRSVLPAHKVFDALHVAAATVYQLDFVVSWNYKHLANANREAKILYQLKLNSTVLHRLKALRGLLFTLADCTLPIVKWY